MVKQLIIDGLKAPRLRDVSTDCFVEFKRLRYINEKQVEEKEKEPEVERKPEKYRVSVDDYDLEIFFAGRWVQASSERIITEEQIFEGVKNTCKRYEDGKNLSLIDKEFKYIGIKMHIHEVEDLIWTCVGMAF